MDLIKIQNLIKDQFPEFYREEFPQLIKFVEKYYEFLGTTNYSVLSSVTDIDKSLDEFLVYLKDNFAKNVPEFGKLSDRDFLHVSKQFYSSRGSNESYKFLFRAMFGKEVELAYPGEFVLKPSDGYWEQEVSFRVFSNDDLTQTVGKFIDVISPDIVQQGAFQAESTVEDISLNYYDADSILGNSNVIVNAWTPDAWDHDFVTPVNGGGGGSGNNTGGSSGTTSTLDLDGNLLAVNSADNEPQFDFTGTISNNVETSTAIPNPFGIGPQHLQVDPVSVTDIGSVFELIMY